jgi:hypothetical protein
MRRKARIDANQNQIVKALRQIPHLSVAITSQLGQGFPDLVIGYRGKNYLIELKDGSKPASARRLTQDELEWHDGWFGRVDTCDSLEAILEALNIKH